MQDHVAITNVTAEPLSFRVVLDIGADFADILSVKAWDFSLGNPRSATPLPDAVRREHTGDGGYRFSDPDGFGTTHVRLSRESDDFTFALTLGPHEAWDL